MIRKKLTVAMLEDDSDDRYLTEEVINASAFKITFDFFSKSSDLFASLQNKKPHLILIDDNSTPENGLEVLKKLKSNNDQRVIPVIILSDSLDPTHRAEYYEAGASSFVLKPSSIEETKHKIRLFFNYWTQVAEL